MSTSNPKGGTAVAFFIGPQCIDVLDRSCIEVCPVDCIYHGDRKLYINPEECIDCGACESACPVQAIADDQTAGDEAVEFLRDNAAFFQETLPGRALPVGNPGGAATTGSLGIDTALVAAYAVSAPDRG
jgi:NAD-dependent dihydropyrimidine dehydrogenase PreA subunit